MTQISTAPTQETEKRDRKVSSILITQPQPTDEHSPYFQLATKYKVKIDFRPFVEVQGVPYKEFRKTKINFLEYTAVVLTSRTAVDHYFRMCAEMKVEMPPEMKYFCINEQTANYLQKYIVIRKRKIFHGTKTAADLMDSIKKHKGEKFIYPCSSVREEGITQLLTSNGCQFTEAVIFETVASDLSDLAKITYDIIAFFSPHSIDSLYKNFPDFQQKNTRLAAFGQTTSKALADKGLYLDIPAPQPNAPSMPGAIELYLKKTNGVK